MFYQTDPKVCLGLVAGSGCLPFFHCSIFISHPSLFVGSTLNFHKIGVIEIEKEVFFFWQKCKTDSLTFTFFHFSPLTFNFVNSVL